MVPTTTMTKIGMESSSQMMKQNNLHNSTMLKLCIPRTKHYQKYVEFFWLKAEIADFKKDLTKYTSKVCVLFIMKHNTTILSSTSTPPNIWSVIEYFKNLHIYL